MEAIPLCLLLNKLHLFNLTQHRLIFNQIVPLHACYIFRGVLDHPGAYYLKNLKKEDIKQVLFYIFLHTM